MSSSATELGTTSYAMLGMLAIKPWTTYELAKQMGRGVGRLWPRAPSVLFNEPKKLVARGLAVASEDRVGKRPRTVYRITPEGLRALEDWLGTPGDGPVLEFEQMLKIFYADHGTKADALAAVATIRAWASGSAAENTAIARSYLDGAAPFPERVAVVALTMRFFSDFADMTSAWADWAACEIEGWPDQPRDATPSWETFEYVARQRIQPS